MQNEFLLQEPVGRLIRKFSVPCVISLLVAALYNIVDQIFVANAAYLGSAGNAANTVVFPLTVVALAIAVMIGDGACAFVSISLGGGQAKRAHHAVGNAVVLVVSSSLVLTAVYFAFMDRILTLFGGTVNEETFAFAREYFAWIAAGIPFFMFGQAMNPIIRSDGSPRFAMATTVAGAALNVVLDPLFIFVFKWGMAGAAIATVAGQILTAACALSYLFRMRAVHLQQESFRPDRKVIACFLPLGISSFLAQASLVAAMASYNNMLRKYGALDPVFGQDAYAQIPMAVVGIVMKVFQIVISVVIGMAAGCIPVVGYNVGARRPDRARALFTRLLALEALVGLVALLVVELVPDRLIAVFGAANESAYYVAFALKAFRIFLSMVILACVNKAAFIFIQALGRPWLSTFLSMMREVVFGVLLPIVLPVFFGLDGILYSMPVADILTFAISAVVIAMVYRELSRDVRAFGLAVEGPRPVLES